LCFLGFRQLIHISIDRRIHGNGPLRRVINTEKMQGQTFSEEECTQHQRQGKTTQSVQSGTSHEEKGNEVGTH
jgi:hypothetical protein